MHQTISISLARPGRASEPFADQGHRAPPGRHEAVGRLADRVNIELPPESGEDRPGPIPGQGLAERAIGRVASTPGRLGEQVVEVPAAFGRDERHAHIQGPVGRLRRHRGTPLSSAISQLPLPTSLASSGFPLSSTIRELTEDLSRSTVMVSPSEIPVTLPENSTAGDGPRTLSERG